MICIIKLPTYWKNNPIYLLNNEYVSLLSYWILSVMLSLVLVGAAWILMHKHYVFEKLSSYECGFEPFNDARKTFNSNFYNIGMMFLIFDIEILMLLPAMFCLDTLTYVGYLWLGTFLSILVVGFIYEWKSSMLDVIK